ncbi:hypothetical protein [Maritalea porphyrae]|uniref:hypothetical protein n=1 Tax=Maritalea porphyrae TaxID=880732 RepID=UPI0022AF3CF4|nr:hypothetical protein [Maritalea porphyrae]MCZ4270934.1 hypothetical protein [Maritalea porphyrae]
MTGNKPKANNRPSGWWAIAIAHLVFMLFGVFLFVAPIVAFAWWAFTHEPVFPDWWVGVVMAALGLVMQGIAPPLPTNKSQ